MGAFSKWYVMKYGEPYKIVKFSDPSMSVVRSAISNTNLKWNEGKLQEGNNNSRKSEVAWIKDPQLLSMLFSMARKMNIASGWYLNLTGVEPVQFGIYSEGGFYDWHIDQHKAPNKGLVRKLSMSLFLTDPEEYQSGEFDLEIYKPGIEPRFKDFKLSKGSALFFQADQWHRVRPISSGLRKSIVAWFYGPPYT